METIDVALVHTPLDHSGGGERQVLHLARELVAMGHRPVLYTNRLDRAACYPALNEGLTVVEAPPGPGLAAAARGFEYAQVDSLDRLGVLALGPRVRRPVDVVNGHNMSTNWAAARAKRRTGASAVWMCNEPPLWYHTVSARSSWRRRLRRTPLARLDPEGFFLSTVDQLATRAMDDIVVLDRKNQARVTAAYRRPSTVVRTGVDVGFFWQRRSNDIREELGLAGAFVVLHVGYAAPWKGQRECLMALRDVRPQAPDARLILAGSNTERTYAPVARELGVADRVTFIERFPDETLASLYATADVLVFPADQTWGLNVTEAWSCGKPPVVSDAAGVAEVVEHGRSGLVFPHGDAKALASHLLDLHDNPGRRRSLGAAGLEYARANLTWRRYAEKMVGVYRHAMGQGPDAAA